MSSEALPPATPAPAEHWLEIQPQGWRLPLPPGLSLMEAAQQAGVRLARSCRNGTCRACRCQLLAGEVRYRIEWPGISAEERAEGLVLPCVAEPLGDVRIDAPAARQL